LRNVRADELAALPLRALLARNPQVDFAQTDDVIMGAASSSGEQSANIARNALLLAGIDDRVPGVTVNRYCASSLQALRMAFHAIRSGEGEQFIAAGVESVSRAGAGAAPDADTLNPRLDGSRGALCNVYIPMGLTAENVAERYDVSRVEQDRWAVISQDRALSAASSGHFDAEIIPVAVPAHLADDGHGGTVELPETIYARRRWPAPRHHDGGSGDAGARVRARGQRHRGQLLSPQRRRRGGAGDERRARRAPLDAPARSHRRLERGCARARVHGRRTDPRDPQAAGRDRPLDR
jgi:acetyl-CoA C-acetyltransferase